MGIDTNQGLFRGHLTNCSKIETSMRQVIRGNGTTRPDSQQYQNVLLGFVHLASSLDASNSFNFPAALRWSRSG
jgi:hypothetical protein